MFESIKYMCLKLLVLTGLLVGSSVLACTPDQTLVDSSIFSVQENSFNNVKTGSQTSINKQHTQHHHSAMLTMSDSDSENSAENADSKSFHENCQCCEFCRCPNCTGCSASSGFATVSMSLNNQFAEAPLGRFTQLQVNYISLSPPPLERPPK